MQHINQITKKTRVEILRTIYDLLPRLMEKASGERISRFRRIYSSESSNLSVQNGINFLNCISTEINIKTKIQEKTLKEYWKPYFTFKSTDEVNYKTRCDLLFKSLFEEVFDYLRRLGEVFMVFQLVPMSKEEILVEFKKLTILALKGELIKQFKYSTNLAFCRHYHLEEPTYDENMLGMSLFPKRLKVRINSLKSSNPKKSSKRKSQILINTLFQGLKKGLLPCRPDTTDGNLIKHCRSLTACGEISEELSGRIEELLDRMFPRPIIKQDPDYDTGISRSSTTEVNYANAGNLGFYLRKYHNNYPLGAPNFIGYISCRNRFEQPIPLYTNLPSREELLEFGYKNTNPLVTPNCILEPMKVRIITKPNVTCYTGMSGVQKELWSYLAKHESGIFRLIGGPITKEDLGLIASDWDVGKLFISGDYSAATDNLKGQISQIILRKVLEPLAHGRDPALYFRCLESMISSDIDYSKGKSHPKDESWPYEYQYPNLGTVKQTNGQLMGHVLSFPILCIANYIAFHLSLEKSEGLKIKPFSRNVLINGDDILFCTTRKHYQIWKEVVSEFGFIPSVGKNFASDQIMQINSKLFYCKSSHTINYNYRVTQLQEIPYVNFGLLTNRKKQDCSRDLTVQRIGLSLKDSEKEKMSDPIFDRLRQLPKIYETLVMDLPNSILQAVNSIWKKHTREYTRLLPCLPIPGWNISEQCKNDREKERYGIFYRHPDPFGRIFKPELSRNDSMIRELFPEFDGAKLWCGEYKPHTNYRKLYKELQDHFHDSPVGPFHLQQKDEWKADNHFVISKSFLLRREVN